MRRTRPQDDLGEHALFASMARRHLAVLDRLFDRLDAPAGATLLRRDRPMKWLWVVCDGRLQAMADDGLRPIEAGDCYGVEELLGHTRSSADLVAATDAHVLVMGRRELLGALDSVPGFAVALLAPGLSRADGRLPRKIRSRVGREPVPTELPVP